MKNILILEDEPLIAMDLQHAFEDAGAQVQVATNCDRAFEMLNSTTFDGAVLDVNLGKGHTCKPVAIELRDRGIPFLLHTGDLDRVGEFLRELEAPIVPKPSASTLVVDRLCAICESRAA